MERRTIASRRRDPRTPEENRRLRVLTQVTLAIVLLGLGFVFQYHRLGVTWMSTAVAITIVLGMVNLLWARQQARSAAGGMLAT